MSTRRSLAASWLHIVLGGAFLAAVSVPAAAQLTLTPYVSGFTHPTVFVQDPRDATVQYVAELGGRIRVIRGGVLQPTDFLDLSSQVLNDWPRGLTGFVFAADDASTGRFFVRFVDLSGNTVVSRFTRSAGSPYVADPASRFDLRFNGTDGPASIAVPRAGNYGGGLAVAQSTGFLYVGTGDGGGIDDPDGNAQNSRSLLGKILVLDVSVSDPHPIGYRNYGPDSRGIPQEVWARGLHNPWQYSLDGNRFYAGDVGQDNWEEIDREYGPSRVDLNVYGPSFDWPYREGAHFHMLPPVPFIPRDPILEYSHADGSWVVGGRIYRGTQLGTSYVGQYFFADFVSGRLWSSPTQVNVGPWNTQVEHTAEIGGPLRLSSFGVDAANELYVVGYDTGTIYAIGTTPVAPAITLQPIDQRLYGGTYPQGFNADASGTPTPTVQWQVSTDRGATWTDIAGATSRAFVFTAMKTMNGNQYRAVFTNPLGTAITRAATLIVLGSMPPDIDGDGFADLVIWRPGTGVWHVLPSAGGYSMANAIQVQWGNAALGDKPMLGDFDGDGKSDYCVWRPSDGTFYWLTSSTGYSYATAHSQQWGNAGLGDVPFLADMDGDGRSDLVVWRASTGMWHWLTSSSGYSFDAAGSHQWGNQALGDTPFVGDIDGDGKGDFIVWRPGNQRWYWLTSSSGYDFGSAGSLQLGAPGDQPLIGDLDADGRIDLTVWTPTTGMWNWRSSMTNFTGALPDSAGRQWGNAAMGDVPLVTSFDNDGHADLLVWRASTGTWYWLPAIGGYTYSNAGSQQWGNQALGDIPVVR